MISNITGVVLAGGKSRRFGSNKALALWDGKPMLVHMLNLLKPHFPKRLVLTKSPQDYAALYWGVPVLPDSMERQHPMTGVLSALKASNTELNFLCACDMPLLQAELIEAMICAAAAHDAVVPVWQGKIQPLCALYSKRCLPAVAALLEDDRASWKCDRARGGEEMVGGGYPVNRRGGTADHAHCADLFARIRTRFFLESEVAEVDPEGLSFMDTDTPEDIRKAREKCLSMV